MSKATPPKLYLHETFEALERLYNCGLVSDRDWRLFKLLWTWSAPRFGGIAGRAQDRLYSPCGATALERRITRANTHILRLSSSATTRV